MLSRRPLKRCLAGAIVALFAASLLLPAISTGAEADPSSWRRGLDIALAGWLGPLGMQFGWYANPLMLVVVIALVRDRKLATWTPVLILLCTGSAMLWDEWPGSTRAAATAAASALPISAAAITAGWWRSC